MAKKHKHCTNASLSGTFGYHRSGTNHNAGIVTDIAAVGIITFDGSGGDIGHQDISRNGVFTLDSQGQGTYQVNSDCTFKLFLADGTDIAHGVIVDGGNELYALSMTPGNAVILVAKKLRPK